MRHVALFPLKTRSIGAREEWDRRVTTPADLLGRITIRREGDGSSASMLSICCGERWSLLLLLLLWVYRFFSKVILDQIEYVIDFTTLHSKKREENISVEWRETTSLPIYLSMMDFWIFGGEVRINFEKTNFFLLFQFFI